MPTLEDHERVEYAALLKRENDAERGGQLCWTAGSLTAAVMLSWAISAKSPGLMIPVVFAIAVGFYGLLRARQQARCVATYIEEFCEADRGSQWFTRMQRLEQQPRYRAVSDWVTVCLANAGVILALMLAWMYSESATRGDLMAGIATGCGVVFAFHSISATVRMAQTDWPAMWQRASGDLKEAPRRAASW